MVKPRYKKKCKICDKDFKSKGPHNKYCSKECMRLERENGRKFIKCSNCDNKIRYYDCHSHIKYRFCSKECQGLWMKSNSEELGLKSRADNARKNWNQDSWVKGLETRRRNGNFINNGEWKRYWKKCNELTLKIREEILKDWDGFDSIDGKYIKNNLSLHFSHGDYPTLDHIKPRSIAFIEGLTPQEITIKENLQFTTRRNNSKKSKKWKII